MRRAAREFAAFALWHRQARQEHPAQLWFPAAAREQPEPWLRAEGEPLPAVMLARAAKAALQAVEPREWQPEGQRRAEAKEAHLPRRAAKPAPRSLRNPFAGPMPTRTKLPPKGTWR